MAFRVNIKDGKLIARRNEKLEDRLARNAPFKSLCYDLDNEVTDRVPGTSHGGVPALARASISRGSRCAFLGGVASEGVSDEITSSILDNSLSGRPRTEDANVIRKYASKICAVLIDLGSFCHPHHIPTASGKCPDLRRQVAIALLLCTSEQEMRRNTRNAQCAGINRHEVENERILHGRKAAPDIQSRRVSGDFRQPSSDWLLGLFIKL